MITVIGVGLLRGLTWYCLSYTWSRNLLIGGDATLLDNGLWSNGTTTDFGSVDGGSIPPSPVLFGEENRPTSVGGGIQITADLSMGVRDNTENINLFRHYDSFS